MISGSLVAIVTPMQGDGAIDFGAWERLLDLHLASGTAGVIVGGSTGESVTLSDEELLLLLARARTRLNGRMALGTWQGIFLFEHRRAPHHREIAVSVVGE